MDQKSTLDIYYLLFLGTTGMFLLSAAAIFLVVMSQRKTQKAKEERHRLEKEYQEQLVFNTILTLEEERKRFARDMHDEIGANLSTVSMQMKGLSVIKSDTEKNARLNEIGEVIEHSISSTRRIAHNLIPPGLEKLGLHHILSEQTDRIAKSSSLKIQVLSEENIVRPVQEAELMIYRILQELLNNTIKHAQARLVTISFKMINMNYHVIYEDDGRGFDMTSKEGLGLGLRNIESRAKMIGATCVFNTEVGKGMKVTILLHSNLN